MQRPRHENGIIRGYQIYGKGITRKNVSWYARSYIISNLSPNNVYEARFEQRQTLDGVFLSSDGFKHTPQVIDILN